MNNYFQLNKINTMSKPIKHVDIDYESPLMQILKLETEQVIAASGTLDDMTESGGEWEIL